MGPLFSLARSGGMNCLGRSNNLKICKQFMPSVSLTMQLSLSSRFSYYFAASNQPNET